MVSELSDLQSSEYFVVIYVSDGRDQINSIKRPDMDVFSREERMVLRRVVNQL